MAFKIRLTLGWHSPKWPDWKDDSEGGRFEKRNFISWLFGFNFEDTGGITLIGFRFLGFYFTVYLRDNRT